MKRIAVVSSFEKYYEIFSLLMLSNVEWDVVGVFMNISTEFFDDKTGITLKPVGELSAIVGQNPEIVVIDEIFPQEFSEVLGKLVGSNNIIFVNDFKSKYAPGIGPMDILRTKVEIVYPRSKCEGRNVTVGDFTYDPPKVHNDSEEYCCKIGKFCSISHDVEILLCVEHRPDWNSTYPFNVLMSDFSNIEGNPASRGDVIIGNDVWIGAKALIMSGVEIGDGCVIAAHSTVTKSIPPYSIAAGTPAKVIKPRFSPELTKRFLDMKWWDWNDDIIYEAIPLLQSQKYDELYEFYLNKVKGDKI